MKYDTISSLKRGALDKIVMVKGWDDLHGGMFHGGLIMIAIGIISISASIFYMNEGNIKNR